MSDIFLSYASQDKERVQPIVEALVRQGLSVWWDRNIPFGKTFDQVIEDALAATSCVIVVWSRNSIVSEWVKNEAYEGLQRHILVPVLIDEVTIPLGFKRIQAAQLLDWESAQGQAEFESLLETIKNIINENRGKQQENADQRDVPREETSGINQDSGTAKSEPQIAQDVNLTGNQIILDLTHTLPQQGQEKPQNIEVEDEKIEPEKTLFVGEASTGKAPSLKTYGLIAAVIMAMIVILIIVDNSGLNSTQNSNNNLAGSNTAATITPSPKLEANNEILKISTASGYERRKAITVLYFPKGVDGSRVEMALKEFGFKFNTGRSRNELETNAIFFGSRVNPEDVKLVAYVLIRAGVEIKGIYKTGSTTLVDGFDRTSVMQVVGDTGSMDRPALTVEQIRDLKF